MPNFAVIFDMDGVIVDNNKFHKDAWLAFGDKYGFRITEAEFKAKVYGKTNAEILVNYFPDADPQTIDDFAEEKEAIFRALYAPHMQLTPGLDIFLAHLAAHDIPCAVASNAPASNINFTLDTLNIRQYFVGMVNAQMVTHGKPHPEIYLKAADLLHAKPERCIVFEDSLTGIKAGQAAGMKVIGITTTYSANELSHTALVINDFKHISIAELIAILD